MSAILTWTRDDYKRFALAVQIAEGSSSFFERVSIFLQIPVKIVEYHYYVALIKSDHVPQVEASQSTYKEETKKKRNRWSDEEHRSFLKGLEVYERGDWKSIARDYVTSRTSVQVASHAQKYFIRQNMESEKRKRKSIHDDPQQRIGIQNTPELPNDNDEEYKAIIGALMESPKNNTMLSLDDDEEFKAILEEFQRIVDFPHLFQ